VNGRRWSRAAASLSAAAIEAGQTGATPRCRHDRILSNRSAGHPKSGATMIESRNEGGINPQVRSSVRPAKD
jgi:hypothetical protein